MKILKIFGLVVAVHVVAFVVIFANPGCRSTSSNVGDTATVAAATPSSSSSNEDYTPVTPVNMDEPAPQPVVTYEPPPPDGRFAPTRPDAVTDVSSEITPASSYTVQRGDSLWTIAHKNNISVAELSAANNLKGKATIQIGQKLLIPAKAAAPTGSSKAEDTSRTYTVKSGDTLSLIASRNGTTVAALRAANNLRGDMVRVGAELKIPEGSGALEPAPASKSTASSSSGSSGQTIHVVKSGDTLGAIARRYKVSVADIARANNITDPTKILVGQELVIPSAGSAAIAAPKVSAPAPATTAPAPVQTAPVQTVPNSSGDLDSALPPDFIDAPVIEVEPSGAPKIE